MWTTQTTSGDRLFLAPNLIQGTTSLNLSLRASVHTLKRSPAATQRIMSAPVKSGELNTVLGIVAVHRGVNLGDCCNIYERIRSIPVALDSHVMGIQEQPCLNGKAHMNQDRCVLLVGVVEIYKRAKQRLIRIVVHRDGFHSCQSPSGLPRAELGGRDELFC